MLKTELAYKLILVEERLNKIEIEGCRIGSILSKFHENMYRNSDQRLSIVGFIKMLIAQWIKGLFLSKPNSEVFSNKILLSKITAKYHCSALIDPIKEHFKDKAVMYTPESKNELIPYNFPKKFIPSNIWRFSKAILHHLIEIQNIYRCEGLEPNRLQLVFTLMIQLNSFNNWHSIFKVYRPAIIVVDFDRDNRNAPMILAAKKNTINTVTLVHGVINPPYGYWPLTANEIWCWGTFQKSQLMAHGISEKQIKVVGSPIVQKISKSLEEKQKSEIKTIGIGLNPMGDEYNHQLLSYLFENDDHIHFNWVVKLHPSMVKSKWMIDLEKENVSIHESDMLSIKDFFDAIDILVVGNSGIGYEAVVNEIPIWVYSPEKEGLGHDKVMIENGNCPDITDLENLRHHLYGLAYDSEYLASLLEKEKSFVLGEFYSCIEKEASNKIIKAIEKELAYAV